MTLFISSSESMTGDSVSDSNVCGVAGSAVVGKPAPTAVAGGEAALDFPLLTRLAFAGGAGIAVAVSSPSFRFLSVGGVMKSRSDLRLRLE